MSETVNRCSFCDEEVIYPHKCKLCGGHFCSKHRLPESHECIGLLSYPKWKERWKESERKCFIATTAYGTPLTREVKVLRNFRDRSLDKNRFGKRLIALYYKISPPLAKTISQSQLRRRIVRILLHPIVKIFKRLGY